MTPSIRRLTRLAAWRRFIAHAVLAIVLLFELISALDLSQSAYTGLVLHQQDRQVGRVSAGSPAELAGFQKGDVLIDPVPSDIRRRPGETVEYRVRRSEDERKLSLTYGRLPPRELARKLSLGVVALAFFVVGWIVYVRRADLVALLFALFCLDIGYVIGNIMNRPQWLLAHPVLEKTIYDASILLLPTFFLHFFLVFPERNERLRQRPRLVYLLYAPSAIAILIAAYLNVQLVGSQGAPSAAVLTFQATTQICFLAALAFGAFLFIRSFRNTHSVVLRRRLKGVVLGTVVGVAPLLVGQTLIQFWPGLEIPGDRFSALALALIPISFGHAIVRYGILDVEIVIKRGVAYAILTAILASLYLAVVMGFGRLLASAAPEGSRGFLTFAAIVVMALVFTPLRARIESWVDRTFYRERREDRETLRHLARGLARMMDLDAILDLVAGSLEQTFHPEFLSIYVREPRDGTRFVCMRHHGGASRGVVSHTDQSGATPEEQELVEWLSSRGDTVNLEQRLAGFLPADMPLRLRRALRRAHAAMLVPIVSERELVAFVVLGSKKSEEPMGREDAALLDTVADQAATAIQNAWLHRDELERRELARELVTARAVQRALLPTSHPDIEGFELEVVSLPSREIGGDLHDFIALGSGRWAVVIGDALGHGIGSALLMAALQATVHGEAEAASSPADVVSAANRKLSRRGDENRFASLFYSELQPARGRLVYVNAGHPYPLLVTPSGDIRTLETGGMLLGVNSSESYEEGALEIERGSLLLYYTDGIVEQMGPDGEEFGRERLAELAAAHRMNPLPEIGQTILREVSNHGASPIEDDVTLLLLRYRGA